MAFELRTSGSPSITFDTEQEAIAAARDVLRGNADAEVDIIDTTTGQPVAPGASGSWREDLAGRVGF